MHARIVLVLCLIGVLAACSDQTASTPDNTTGAECAEPSNPWSGDGGGHEAGFTWAEENHYECPNDHGQSFEEGCEEYVRQLSRYEACSTASKRDR